MFDDNRSECRFFQLDFIELDHIADIEVEEVVQLDAAFHALTHFLDIVLKTAEGRP